MGETHATNMMKQALLLLLIGLAVVRAMPRTNEDVYDEDTIDDFSNSDSRRLPKGSRASLTATFNEEGTIEGTIKVIQSKVNLGRFQAIWKADFTAFDLEEQTSLCPSGELNWHVH